MNPTNKWVQWAGYGLNALIAAMMIAAGSSKVLGFAPPDMLAKFGLTDYVLLIGAGEIISALLLLTPRISPLGVLLTSGFWGGAICMHMSHGESFLLPSVLLALTWVGAYLRGSVPLLVGQPVTAAAPAVRANERTVAASL